MHATGRPTEARQAWREALALYEELNAPQAPELRARLNPDQV
ncbi:hypothetical protein EKG83_37070 [Saccharothrix syringae]|uniref:Tetratricopeptide repeat protein n=1 Tax=Saccharothrix syringae TaxID=103733 RepID=A0A5Q0HFS4_SACSY|nr:hypothetical protein EKG83_37070 [Saccharothrix syringae]